MQIADAYPNAPSTAHLPGGIEGALKSLTAPQPVESAPESESEPKPLTTAEKKLIELDQAKQEALEAKREAAETREELDTERKVSAALETEVQTANGKPQVRAEIVGAREEIRQLKYKIWERENEITELRRENKGLRALLKKSVLLDADRWEGI